MRVKYCPTCHEIQETEAARCHRCGDLLGPYRGQTLEAGRAAALELAELGVGIREIARRLRYAPSTVSCWVQKYSNGISR